MFDVFGDLKKNQDRVECCYHGPHTNPRKAASGVGGVQEKHPTHPSVSPQNLGECIHVRSPSFVSKVKQNRGPIWACFGDEVIRPSVFILLRRGRLLTEPRTLVGRLDQSCGDHGKIVFKRGSATFHLLSKSPGENL